jgi:hypothetical protein
MARNSGKWLRRGLPSTSARRSAASVLAYAVREVDRLETRYGFDSNNGTDQYGSRKYPAKFVEWDTLNRLLEHFNRSTWNREDPVMVEAERISGLKD